MGCVLPVPLSLAARGHPEDLYTPPASRWLHPCVSPKKGVGLSAVTPVCPALPNLQNVLGELLGFTAGCDVSCCQAERSLRETLKGCYEDVCSGGWVTRYRPLEQRSVNTLGNPMARRASQPPVMAGFWSRFSAAPSDLDKSLLLSGSQYK